MIRLLEDFNRPGAAVLIYLQPPCHAQQTWVLRRYDDQFPDTPDDPESVRVEANPAWGVALDWHQVVPGVTHWYAPYYWVGGAWQRGEPKSIVPTVESHPPFLDSVDVLRERIEIGLNGLVGIGCLRHPRGRFHVLIAPPAIEDTALPAVAVHFRQSSSEMHWIGGFVWENRLPDGTPRDTEGWHSRCVAQIGIWTINPDERRLLRQAVRDTLIASRDLLELLGIQELDVEFSDSEEFEAYKAPLYMSQAVVRYLAPDVIWNDADALAAIRIGVWTGDPPELASDQTLP